MDYCVKGGGGHGPVNWVWQARLDESAFADGRPVTGLANSAGPPAGLARPTQPVTGHLTGDPDPTRGSPKTDRSGQNLS